MKAQWDCLRQNLGEWHGSFTQVSPGGDELSDTPSILKLEEKPTAQSIQLTLTRFPQGGTPHEMVRSFSFPGPGPTVPFFETGAFSQGSLQWAPFGQFGAELAFTCGDRRLRLVQLFEGMADGTSQLKSITVIRETRAGCDEQPSPSLTPDCLVGRWQGTAVTLFSGITGTADPKQMKTDLAIALHTDHPNEQRVTQTLSFGSGDAARVVETSGRIDGDRLVFDQGDTPVQVLLLPGGGSVVSPVRIERDRPFFLEAGWLVTPNHRQRMVRQYNERGEWTALTLVQEYKV